MRRWSISIFRWALPVLLIYTAVTSFLFFPVTFLILIALAVMIFPLTQQFIFKKLHLPSTIWTKSAVTGTLFVLFSLTYPKPPVKNQLSVLPTPEATASAQVRASATPTATLSALVSPAPSAVATTAAQFLPVTKVVDGDTIKVQFNDTVETVRVVGVNTPETVDPRRPVQCFGKEASAQMKLLVAGKNVRLEIDQTQSNRDKYGRLLRFVFLEDGTDVGLELIKGGYAQEALYSKVPHKYRDSYVAAQKIAQEQKKGLWADDACVEK